MSTYNALTNQQKKKQFSCMENIGIAVWWSLSRNQPNYSFSWQVLLSQIFIHIPTDIYKGVNHVLTLINNTNKFILVET